MMCATSKKRLTARWIRYSNRYHVMTL